MTHGPASVKMFSGRLRSGCSRRVIDLPDRARLEGRYEQFRQAAG
jgi:hypothetical protein